MDGGAERHLKIVFITPDEPSVIPIFFDKVMPRLRGEISAVGVIRPIYKNSSWIKQGRRFVDSFGVREFSLEVMEYTARKVINPLGMILPTARAMSVKNLARFHHIRLLTPEDVNTPQFLDELRRIGPDLVVSVSCPQIFKKTLLELPRLGCLNVHSALLPRYRGMLPTFWVLANGEKETGVTVHYMTPGIDGGDIIAQECIPISPEETLRSLMRKCKSVAADLVLDVIERFRLGSVTALPNPVESGSYFSFPKRADVQQFKALGRRMR